MQFALFSSSSRGNIHFDRDKCELTMNGLIVETIVMTIYSTEAYEPIQEEGDTSLQN